VKRVAFAADYPVDLTHPLHRAVVEHAAVSRAEVLTWGPVGSATTLIWVDADRETATEMLESEPVAETSLVAGDGGTYAFTRQTEYAFADDLLDLVAAADVAFLPPLAFRADRTARFEAVGRPTHSARSTRPSRTCSTSPWSRCTTSSAATPRRR